MYYDVQGKFIKIGKVKTMEKHRFR